MKNRRGTGNGNAKLSEEAVWIIRFLRALVKDRRVPSWDPRSVAALAQRFGVQPACISKIMRGRSWSHHADDQ